MNRWPPFLLTIGLACLCFTANAASPSVIYPAEARNLADQHPDIVAKLRPLHDQHLR